MTISFPSPRRWRTCAFLALALFLCRPPVEAAKVAVLAAEGLENPAALLTASLSSQAGVEVMEREQINAILHEKNLQNFTADRDRALSAGKILGADAVVFLTKAASGKSLSAQLVATGPGAVVTGQSAGLPLGDPEGWARYTATAFSGPLQKFPLENGSRALVGVVGIRSPAAGGSARELERESAYLITRALAGMPGLFVLERSRIRESDWEKQIADLSTQGQSYWSSAWLFDGNVTDQGKNLTIDGRLSPIAGGTPIPIRAEGSTPAELAGAVAGKIAESLNTSVPAVSHDPTAESRQFLAEAQWAMKWNEFEQAERAADAAWALGLKDETTGLIRSKAPAAACRDQIVADNVRASSEPAPETLDRMTRAFSNLRLTWQVTQEKPSPRFAAELAETLRYASIVLQRYFYLPRERTPEETEQLDWLRQEIRSYLPFMAREVAAVYRSLPPRDRKIVPGSPHKAPIGFYLNYGWYGGLWGDNPDQSAQIILDAFSALAAIEPADRAELLIEIVTERGFHRPLTASWEKTDDSQIGPIRDKLLKELEQRGPDQRLASLMLGVWRYYYSMRQTGKTTSLPKLQEAMTRLQAGLLEMSGEIVGGTLPGPLVYAALDLGHEVTTDKQEYAAALKPSFDAFLKQFMLILLKANYPGEPAFYNRLITGVTYTPEERDAISAAFLALAPSIPKSHLSHYQESIAQATAGHAAPSTADAQELPGLPPTRQFRVSEDSHIGGTESLMAHGSKFYFRQYLSELGKTEVLEIDPAANTQKRLALLGQDDPVGFGPWAVDDRYLYFADQGKLLRLTIADGKKETLGIPLIGGQVTHISLVKGHLYMGTPDGVIVRVSTETLQAELLASSRRKPPETALDGLGRYNVDSIFEGEGGIVFILERLPQAYVWREGSRKFEVLNHPVFPSSSQRYAPDFVLRWVGSGWSQRGPIQTAPAWYLLTDPGRTGSIGKFKSWPPPMKLHGGESFPSQYLDSGVHGSTMYTLFHGGSDPRQHYLKVLAPNNAKAIPLREPKGNKQSFYSQIVAGDDGVMIGGRGPHFLLFYSYADIENFRP